jgi:hypothetical protein
MGYANRLLAGLAMAAVATVSLSTSIAATDEPQPMETTHMQYDGWSQGSPAEGSATGDTSSRAASGPICSTAPTGAANVQVSCEGDAPHNETTIAVNPTNQLNIVASANDYEFRLAGGTLHHTLLSRAAVTFDGGRSWTTYAIDFGNYNFTGDPALAFDGSGTVYLATLGTQLAQGIDSGANPDIIVVHSKDGGRTWSAPVRVAAGRGQFGGTGVFNDKEYITAWGSGNALLTWTTFNIGANGFYISSPIHATVSHDGGMTWTDGGEVSGSAPFCVGSPGTPSTPTACNADQGSVPVVAADGTAHVAFISNASNNTFRDQYLEVQLDPQTARRIAGPFRVAGLVDGATDYPINIDGRQTYEDSQFRTWAVGNIAADPANAAHLAVAWSDMRNSTLPAPSDPYSAHTNSDVVVSQSFDGGRTWSAPVALRAGGDQFMPWAAYDTAGRLRIGYFDRSYGSANHDYGYSLASERRTGSLAFSVTQLTTVLSDPTRDGRWFAGRTVDADFPHPTTFMGDYSAIAALLSGGVVALWTDMRATSCFGVRCGAAQNAEFAAAS